MEKFMPFPFTKSSPSNSCIAVGAQQLRRSKPDSIPSLIVICEGPKEEENKDSSSSGGNLINTFRSLVLPKPNISVNTDRLFKGFKTISRIFGYKDEIEEEEVDLEIGSPTDVSHTRFDGSADWMVQLSMPSITS